MLAFAPDTMLTNDRRVFQRLRLARPILVRGLVSYRLLPDGRWLRAAAIDSRQPPDGFTVAAYEEDSDLEVLCRSYELADDEARQLIRLVAELSVRTVTSP